MAQKIIEVLVMDAPLLFNTFEVALTPEQAAEEAAAIHADLADAVELQDVIIALNAALELYSRLPADPARNFQENIDSRIRSIIANAQQIGSLVESAAKRSALR
jgi:hypothetical protein